MNVRRSQIHIFVDILRLIQRKNGIAKPTHILYGANLSHTRLKKYLSSLMSMGFVEKVEQTNRIYYKITENGSNFLKEFKKIEELSEAFGVPL